MEIDICSLCKVLWLTLDDVCPCKCPNCYSMDDLESINHFKKFNDYIESQVELVKGLASVQDVMPAEKIKITYEIKAINNTAGLKH